MRDVIYRDDAINEVRFNTFNTLNADEREMVINRIPSVDVVPKHDVEIIIDEITKRTSSAEAIHGDGRNNMKRYPNCHMRTSLGNCDVIGGFCTSINAPICDAFHKLVDVAQGEWICKGDYAICSKCGGSSGTQFDGVERTPRATTFCPHCGRRMKGAEHEID